MIPNTVYTENLTIPLAKPPRLPFPSRFAVRHLPPRTAVRERAYRSQVAELLPNPIDRSRARRRELQETLFELVREGVVNALVHRDYGVDGAKCQLVVTSDTITVKSPGGPLPPITLEQMQAFNAPMLSRNPVLHYVFARMEMAEERGLGLKSMKAHSERAGLPLPRYSWDDPYLVLHLYASAAAAASDLPPHVLDALSADERNGWQVLATMTSTTRRQYAERLGIEDRTAQRQLRRFVEFGLIRRIGAGSATRYQIVR